MVNPHKNMDLRKFWFKRGEFNELESAIICNEKEKAFEILLDMQERGDLI